ncbi:complement factor H-related protein 2-like [Dendropsophus ebraccatus]|uniref:complement factor H-related protein 2-like n=1 Tax=Dendropsophus ebraccatus TaxID=150705 RepID=UPI00383160F1
MTEIFTLLEMYKYVLHCSPGFYREKQQAGEVSGKLKMSPSGFFFFLLISVMSCCAASYLDDGVIGLTPDNYTTEVKECGPPPAILYGDLVEPRKEKYTSGDTVEYGCLINYVLEGNRIVKCVEDVWEELPICQGPCIVEEKVMIENNIELKWNDTQQISLHGSTVEFTCSIGYASPPGMSMRIVCTNIKLDYPKCFAAKAAWHRPL